MACPIEFNDDPTGYTSKRKSSVLAFGGDPQQRVLNLNSLRSGFKYDYSKPLFHDLEHYYLGI